MYGCHISWTESHPCWAPSLFLSARVKFPEMSSRYAKTSSKLYAYLYQCKKKSRSFSKLTSVGGVGVCACVFVLSRGDKHTIFKKKRRKKKIRLHWFIEYNSRSSEMHMHYFSLEVNRLNLSMHNHKSCAYWTVPSGNSIWTQFPACTTGWLTWTWGTVPICVPGGYRFGYNCCDAIGAGG